MFLAPNGKVFNAGPARTTRYLETSGTGAWSTVASRSVTRGSGSAVMYGRGKILIAGGSSGTAPGEIPHKSAEVIDLTVSTPTWRLVGSMAHRRRHLNATMLPDGQVLVTGGTSGEGVNNKNTPVKAAEMWDPVTETWRTLASGVQPRLYHSAALLLPDARVLVTAATMSRRPSCFHRRFYSADRGQPSQQLPRSSRADRRSSSVHQTRLRSPT
jgi:Kelch motif